MISSRYSYIRLAPGERLTRRQWIEAGDQAERQLGFTGQPCAMSFHIDRATGEKHLHLAWSRIARRKDGRLIALDPGLYKNKLKELSRRLERELSLKIVSSGRVPDAKTCAADRKEFEEARRLGTSLKHKHLRSATRFSIACIARRTARPSAPRSMRRV